MLLAAVLVAQTLPEASVPTGYLVAWVAVAFISGTPGLVGIVVAGRARNETRTELAAVRQEVMPNGGSSSFDLLHRLAWETHERTQHLPDLSDRLTRLELTPCPYTPRTEDKHQ